MQRFSLLLGFGLLFFRVANAHPHTYVDQQALLNIGPNVVNVSIRIVPSVAEGQNIFAKIDANADDLVSDGEAADLAARVIAMVQLEVDGQHIALQNFTATVPGIAKMSSGAGVIEVEAMASFELAAKRGHRLTFAIAFDDFSQDWQVQPFFHSDFITATATRSVAREDTSNRISIVFDSL